MRAAEKVIVLLMLFLIAFLAFATSKFFEIRGEMARIEAEGIECCYALHCEYNIFGKVSCTSGAVAEPDIKNFDFTGVLNGSRNDVAVD